MARQLVRLTVVTLVMVEEGMVMLVVLVVHSGGTLFSLQDDHCQSFVFRSYFVFENKGLEELFYTRGSSGFLARSRRPLTWPGLVS